MKGRNYFMQVITNIQIIILTFVKVVMKTSYRTILKDVRIVGKENWTLNATKTSEI